MRILNSYDSGCFSPSPASSPCPSLAASTATLNSSICSADIYENTSIISGSGSSANGSGSGYISASQTNITTTSSTCCTTAVATSNLQQTQRQGTRRSWHVSPNKVSFCLPTALHNNKLICGKKRNPNSSKEPDVSKRKNVAGKKKITGFFFVVFLYVEATVKWKISSFHAWPAYVWSVVFGRVVVEYLRFIFPGIYVATTLLLQTTTVTCLLVFFFFFF